MMIQPGKKEDESKTVNNDAVERGSRERGENYVAQRKRMTGGEKRYCRNVTETDNDATKKRERERWR